MTNEEIRSLFTKLTGITWDVTALPDDEKKKAILTWLIPDGKILDNPESERAQGIKELMQELDLDIEDKFEETENEEQIYTIIFKNGDEILKTVQGPHGTPVSCPDVEKEGFDFNGWSLDGENAILPVDAIYDTDLTYVALWIEKQPQEVETEATFEYIYNEATWNESFENGVLGVYYQNNPDEDRWNTVENRACNFNDKVYDVEINDGTETVTGQFKAHWDLDNVQSIINVEDSEEVYYTDMFYSLDENVHTLYTDINLTEPAGKTAIFTAIHWNPETCPQCWTGAINAPGAQWPWVGITPEIGFEGIVKFVYDEGEPVYPFGEEVKKFMKGYGVVSVPGTFGNIEFDESKLKVYYITFE